MLYKRRGYYAAILSLFIFVMGFLYVLNPDINNLKTLRQKQINLQKQVNELKKSVHVTAKIDETNVETVDYFKNMLMLAYYKRVIIQVIQFKYSEQVESAQLSKMHLIVHGANQAVFSFLSELLQPESGIVVLDFKYKILTASKLAMAMDVLVFKNKIKTKKEDSFKFANISNPFCFPHNANPFRIHKNTNVLASIPVLQMKMIGYLRQQHKTEGLVLLPNSAVITVKINDVIGKEHGVVNLIEPSFILIKLAAGKILKLQSQRLDLLDS